MRSAGDYYNMGGYGESRSTGAGYAAAGYGAYRYPGYVLYSTDSLSYVCYNVVKQVQSACDVCWKKE